MAVNNHFKWLTSLSSLPWSLLSNGTKIKQWNRVTTCKTLHKETKTMFSLGKSLPTDRNVAHQQWNFLAGNPVKFTWQCQACTERQKNHNNSDLHLDERGVRVSERWITRLAILVRPCWTVKSDLDVLKRVTDTLTVTRIRSKRYKTWSFSLL